VAFQSARHLHARYLGAVPAIRLDHLQAGGGWSQPGLSLHDQFSHPVEQLHPEVGKAADERVGGVGADEQVGPVDSFELLHLPLDGLPVGVACKLHVEEHADLRVHHCLRHFNVGELVGQRHDAAHGLSLSLLFEVDASLLFLLPGFSPGVDLLHFLLQLRLVHPLLFFTLLSYSPLLLSSRLLLLLLLLPYLFGLLSILLFLLCFYLKLSLFLFFSNLILRLFVCFCRQ
jgi:hypothetical protein